jgi:hypothetical protein
MSSILEEMFADATTPADLAAKLESYKEKMSASIAEVDSGQVAFGYGHEISSRTLRKGISANPAKAAGVLENLEKSLTADQVESLGTDIAAMRQYLTAEITKDWTPTNPVGGTGLVPYDLEAPAKVLVPRDTPLRNSIPRVKGQGNARKFKRIDSFSNAGVPGGASTLSPFFNSLTQTSTYGGTGNLTLARPQKISYTGTDATYAYVELGFSDSVEWVAQFQGLGFDDLRALSHTALLWSHLLGEERAMLYGRGATGNGYEGSVSAPSGVTATGVATGGTIGAATYSVYVTANTGFGESLPATVATTAALTGSTNVINVVVGTEPAGAINYNVYVGTTAGIANAHLQGTFAGSSFTLTSYNSTSAIAGNTDTSFAAAGYDGFLSVLSDSSKTGYLSRLNGKFSTTNPGTEFDTALVTMWTNNAADPDEIWLTGAARAELNQLMRIGGTNGAASGYRTNTVTGSGDVTMSTTVTGYVNPATSKVVDIRVHRFMPTGACLIRSTSLPIPDSNVTAPTVSVNVQDYMAVDWPQIQMTYDASTYQIGTIIHYAPAWSGLILGIQ